MMRILLVDDDASVRRSLARLLRAHDHEVLEAENADAALCVLETTRPALMLMDLIMPGQNALEAARRIKAEPGTASLPIVALTATPPAAESDRTLFAAIMLKPCRGRELLEAIESAR